MSLAVLKHPGTLTLRRAISMNIYRIYRATNSISGKVYIGFTSGPLKGRMTTHKHNCFTRLYKNKFYDAIRSYGWDQFIWDEIYVAKESVKAQQSHTLKVMEDYFIHEYDSLNNGYNIAPGGGGFPDTNGANNGMFNKNHTEESITLMKQNRAGKTAGAKNPMWGVKRTEEWLDENQRGENHPLWGKNHSDISLENIRKGIAATAKECPHCKKVVDKGNYNRWHGDNCKLAIQRSSCPLQQV
jgi:group I intron endonuclease